MQQKTTIEYGSIPAEKVPKRRQQMPPIVEHLGKHRQYWRDIILGVNDGLISTFLLVVGVVGSGLSVNDVLLTAISGALAGAVSMSAGEYVATKSQNEVLQGEIGLEKVHIRDDNDSEMAEIDELLERIGVPINDARLRKKLFDHYRGDEEALLKLMVALEFGVVEEEERSPFLAAIVSGLLFFAGSLPSLLPFAFEKHSTSFALFVACGSTISALLVVGGIKTWATRGHCFTAAMENLLVAGIGGVLAYFVGVLFDKIIR